MIEWITQLDANILLFLQEVVRNPFLTPIVTVITSLGNGGVVWVALSIALLVPKRTRETGAAALLALLISLLINNVCLKNIVGRIRPYDLIEGLVPLVAKPRDYSFPSGHTGSSFAAAWVFFRRLPRRFGVPALILAGFIGLSRLYVGVHYPTDVLFGVFSGICCGVIACFLTQRLWRRTGDGRDGEVCPPQKRQ